MNSNDLIRFVDGLSSAPQESPLVDAPEYALQRHVRSCAPPAISLTKPYTIDETRNIIKSVMDDYANKMPDYALLIRAKAGVGKTTAGVRIAEKLAAAGQRVGYVGPRHDFFNDLMVISRHPELWYEWLPRHDHGDEPTCIHTRPISSWMAKGYNGIDFCSGVCGWEYVNHDCPYHAQKRRSEPIVFIQHQHLTVGHPFKFDILIGDESPLGAFLDPRWLEAKEIMLPGLVPNTPLYNLLSTLSALAIKDSVTSGEDLSIALGGPQQLLETLETVSVPEDAVLYSDIHSIEEALAAPYNYLPSLAGMLTREAQHYANGYKCIPRTFLGAGGLMMLMRNSISETMPTQKIWLDATGNPRIYAACFSQVVGTIDANPELQGRVHVVSDRANGMSNFVGVQKHIDQASQLIERVIDRGGYKRPGIVTFQGLVEDDMAFGCQALNFYGARGTNALEHCDVVFVAGTPVPNQDRLIAMASMIWFERNIPFNPKWSDKWLPYNYEKDGEGLEYPAGGYWDDVDLVEVQMQLRESEIVQAVHRGRPVIRDVDIYLLSNLPIAEIRVDSVMSSSDIMGSPMGVDAYKWGAFEQWADAQDYVSAKSIVESCKIDRKTARLYVKELLNRGWVLDDEVVITRNPGRRGPKEKAYRKA